MCGIAGLFRPGGIDPTPVGEMLAALAHRGPDDEGLALVREAGEAPWAALGVRRLSIVDPAGGHQPARDPTGRWRVTLNGEIYNHARLRTEVAAHGTPFRSRSDTEVVASLVALHGFDTALERLRGMFALAVLDTRHRRLRLVRDRLGVKPLYWTVLPDGTVAWASEARGLLVHPAVRRRLDRRAVEAVLLWEYVPAPWTPWAGIRKLEPGTVLEADADGVRTRTFWRPPIPADGHGGSLRRWARSVAGSVQVAVMQRMGADVDVGAVISGGLDSASVAAIAAARRRRPLRTFSVAVDAPGFDEGAAAREVAAALGTEHREIRFRAADALAILPEILGHVDEPLADSSLLPTWWLMRHVREAGLRCVLSGDGADESFAGYPTYLAHRLAERLGPLEAAARSALAAVARRMAVTYEGVTRDYMARRFADGLGRPWQRRHQVWMGAWLPEEIGAGEAVWEVVDRHAAAVAGAGPVSRALYLDQRLYLAEGVLTKVDRASMAWGVEVRSPYLDHMLVELAAEIPDGHKLRGRTGKLVLRRALADVLPEAVLRRPKRGFGAPLGAWLRGPLAPLLDGLPEALEGWVPPDRLRRVIAEHRAGRADHRRRLWTAIVLARWRDSRWGVG